VNAEKFRRIALSMNEATEGAHMGHPDFRVNGKIFATLHAGDKTGMIKLPPEQQQAFIDAAEGSFTPVNGAWGRQGCTIVTLATVDEDVVGDAMTLAWQEAIKLTKRTKAENLETP